MVKGRTILSTVGLILLLGVVAPQFAQSVPQGPGTPDKERRAFAIGFVRTINVAEVMEVQTYGAFAPWQTLLAHQAKHFQGFLDAKRTGLEFGDAPEIFPGWNLRINVHADGQGFDLMLQDVASKQAPYAAYTNESGVIWNAAPIE
jgi:hypothetical protein